MKKIGLILLLSVFCMTPKGEAYRQIASEYDDQIPVAWPLEVTPSFTLDLCTSSGAVMPQWESYRDVFREVIDSWAVKGSRFFNPATGLARFGYNHTLGCDRPAIADGEVRLAFWNFTILAEEDRPSGVDAIGMTRLWEYENLPGEIRAARVLFATRARTSGGFVRTVRWIPKINDPNPGNLYPGFEENPTYSPPPYVFKFVALHEVGHALGLHHVDEENPEPRAIPQTPQYHLSPMAIKCSGPGCNNLERIYADDHKAMISIYPPLNDPGNLPEWDLSVSNYGYETDFLNLGVRYNNTPQSERHEFGDAIHLEYTSDVEGPLGGAAFTELKFFLSSDDRFDAGDFNITPRFFGSETRFSGSTPNGSMTFALPTATPEGTPIPYGAYYILQVVNPEDVLENDTFLEPDLSNNVLPIVTRIQIVDSEPPVFDPGGLGIYGDVPEGNFTFYWPTARDNGSGLAKYIVVWHYYGGTIRDSSSEEVSPQTTSYPFRVPNGQWTLSVIAKDRSGNQTRLPAPGDPPFIVDVTSSGHPWSGPLKASFLSSFRNASFSLDELQGGIPVPGTAAGIGFLSYSLTWAPGWQPEDVDGTITTSSTPGNGILANLTPSTMAIGGQTWGERTIQLTVHGQPEIKTDVAKLFIGIKPGWSENQDSLLWHPLAVDLNQDGNKELIGVNGGTVIAYTYDGTVLKEWRPGTGRPGIIAAEDLNGDGLKEIIVPYPDKLYALTLGEGDILWRAAVVGDLPDGVRRAPVISDLDNDGSPEVIYASGPRLYAFHADGTPLQGWNPVDFGRSDIVKISSPAVADFEGAGCRRVVVATNQGVYAFDCNGARVPGWNPVSGISYPSPSTNPNVRIPVLPDVDCAPVIGDFDNDGALEVFVAVANPNGMVYIISTNGSIEWSMSVNGEVAGTTTLGSAFYFGSPSISSNKTIHLMAYHDAPGRFASSLHRHYSVVNLFYHNGDRYQRGLTQFDCLDSVGGGIYGEDFSAIHTPIGPIVYFPNNRDRNFTSHSICQPWALGGLRALGQPALMPSPLQSDRDAVWSNLEGDSRAELIFTSMGDSGLGSFFVAEWPNSTASGEGYWPMFRHDPARTALAGHEPRPPVFTAPTTATLNEGETLTLQLSATDPNSGPEAVWLDNLTFAATLDGRPLSDFGASLVATNPGTSRPATVEFRWRPGYDFIPDGTLSRDLTLRVTVSDGHAGTDTKEIAVRVNDVPLITSNGAFISVAENSTATLPITLHPVVTLESGETVTLRVTSVTPSRPLNWDGDARWDRGSAGNNWWEPRTLDVSNATFSLLWIPDPRIAAAPIDPDANPPIPPPPNPSPQGPYTITFEAMHPDGGISTLSRNVWVHHANYVPDLGGSTRGIYVQPGVTGYTFVIKANDLDNNFRYQNHTSYISYRTMSGGTIIPMGAPYYGPGISQAKWTFRYEPLQPVDETYADEIRVTVRDYDGTWVTQRIPARFGTKPPRPKDEFPGPD